MDGDSIGRRVAAARKLRGLTQRALAERAHVSYSLIAKVEAGHVPASPAFHAAVARALQVQPAELTGQPYRGATARADRGHAAIADIRTVLWEHDAPDLELADPPASTLVELWDAVGHTAVLRRRARYLQLAETLPGLLRDLLAAAEAFAGRERQEAYKLLQTTYGAVHTVTWALGYADLSALAVERIMWAAQRTGDHRGPAVAIYLRGQNYLLAGAYDVGLRAMEAARAGLEGEDPATLAVQGALHLRSSVLAARRSDADGARSHIAAAEEFATRLGVDSTHYELAFGPSNVRIHQVAAEVELGNGTDAAGLAENWQPGPGVQPSRAGHHWIDLGRGWLMHGDRHRALRCVVNARRVAPQQARYHPMVRETLHALARAERRTNDTLRELAVWAGIPD